MLVYRDDVFTEKQQVVATKVLAEACYMSPSRLQANVNGFLKRAKVVDR